MTTSMSASSLICSTNSGTPGSPYRSSSGSLNGLTSRPSLNKELVQKLRSMTETIKILSDENIVVKEENQRLRRNSSLSRDMEQLENYDELSKSQLIALTVSYDKKFKDMADELEKVKEVSTEQQMNKNNMSNATKSEKDKYKSLARRLKEERNNYKCALQEKQNEQSVLKDEMEKMSDLISELRENCHKLQSELLQVRRRSASERFSDASVQTDHRRTSSARRSSIGSGGSSESVRRARSVYSVNRNQQVINNTSKNTSASNPKPRPSMNFRNQTATSAAKTVAKNNTTPNNHHHRHINSQPGTPKSGPKFAKPVTKPSASPRINSGADSPLKKTTMTSLSSPSKIPIVRGIPRSHVGSSKIPTPSKIPGPKSLSPSIVSINNKNSSPQQGGTPSSSSSSGVAKTTYVKDEEPGVVAARPAIISDEIDEEEDILIVNKDETLQEYSITLMKNKQNEKAESLTLPVSSSSSSSYSSKADDDDDDEVEGEEFDDDFHRHSDSAKDPSADDEGSRDSSVINSVPCTPKTKKKIENLKQSLTARRVHRTWQHFYEELEERNLSSPNHALGLKQSQQHQPLTLKLDEKCNRKYSLPVESTMRGFEDLNPQILSEQLHEEDAEEALMLSRNTLKNRIHTARPWLKNKAKSAKELLCPREDGSSEEDTNPSFSNSNKAFLRLQADKDLFTAGKVSAIKAQFNERRRLPDRSDGITDDDEELGI
ncbi:uncharacterized protein [Lepeophtheirus salmonis]|uniref:uncharacterized protein n=1 Tax=Lepeophtheirus salmonis TaxID=72036 RepID=UPI001AE92ED1|nr:uncharacterized protein DDB_G0284459-like [Lepeophtheirus salmonis]XP_040564131.1 uncharacterized protein DDB_G0284459-like [Lepeophtheirus salmonis]